MPRKVSLYTPEGQLRVVKKLMDSNKKSFVLKGEFGGRSARIKAWMHPEVMHPIKKAVEKTMFGGFGEIESKLSSVFSPYVRVRPGTRIRGLVNILHQHPGWCQKRGYQNEFAAAIGVITKLRSRADVLGKVTHRIRPVTGDARAAEVAFNAIDAFGHVLAHYMAVIELMDYEIDNLGWQSFLAQK